MTHRNKETHVDREPNETSGGPSVTPQRPGWVPGTTRPAEPGTTARREARQQPSWGTRTTDDEDRHQDGQAGTKNRDKVSTSSVVGHAWLRVLDQYMIVHLCKQTGKPRIHAPPYCSW